MQGSWRNRKNIKKHNREKTLKEERAVMRIDTILKRVASHSEEKDKWKDTYLPTEH